MKRPYLLMIDSGSLAEPANRYFGTLSAALEALAIYPEHFQRFAWISYLPENQWLIRDGKEVRVG